MELIEIQRRLERLLNQIGGDLPPEQIEDMKELVQAGEPGVALENFCTQLFEYEVPVSLAVVAELEELGRALGVDKKYCARLPE
jgi:hypothetical protein